MFLPENDFKTCSTVSFPKSHPDFGDLETNERHEIIFFSAYELDIIKNILGTYKNTFKVPYVLRAKFKKKKKKRKERKKETAEKAKNLNFTIFWVLFYISWSANPRKIVFNGWNSSS